VVHASSTIAAHASSMIVDRVRLTIGVLHFEIVRPTRTADRATTTGVNLSHGHPASPDSPVHAGAQALARVLVRAAEAAVLKVDDLAAAAAALAHDAHHLAPAN
jgi:hypothetical protein